MMNTTWLSRVLAVAAVAVLGACGGGGGGGGAPGAATVTLNGTVTFDSVPNATGTLSYSGVTVKPVRGALVEIVDGASAVLATASTDANGAYSVAVPSSTSVQVRVKAQMLQTGSGPSWNVTVRDNTQSDAIYAMETPAFSTAAVGALTRDLHAPSGWDGTSYASTRVAGPFALLDTIYTNQAKVLSVAPGTAFPQLRVFWSVNNLPSATFNRPLGQIGTTFFTNDPSSGRAIYVLGKENVDTDEYDSPVVAHEWGHYYQSAFSRDDSPGGSHSLSELLDRRLAFSEGWGNAWSGIALERSNYTDSTGPSQALGGNLDLRAGLSANPGWYREASIHSILWNLNSQVGFKPIHDTLTSAAFRNGTAVTSIHPFAIAFNGAAPGSVPTLNGLLTGQGITVPSDPFGSNETNDGTLGAFALPLYRTANLGVGTAACVTNQQDPLRHGNKLGSYAYLRFTAPAARNYAISVTGPGGSDPDFVVYQGRQVANASAETTPVQAASVPLGAGEGVVVLNDFNNSSPNTCFTVTIQ